ncbi:alpha/beta fold hydrolase [Microcoleus sp. bin38.metabat.b11b12b14.051]|uniref:alpha/beta hydrolase n=1 Tax=Microcoleus sp. bin38.metabat.b11b12b14.051 TaxID=2742709 RepID=UPI0025DF4757|nr:alpha/beta fold hydrolase [Microcoleus sp. bin38.metabat.b11b12b14.051]
MKQWRPFLLKFAIGYSLVCVALYFQQQRLIFFPNRQLQHTPSLYQLNYQDVWISISNQSGKPKYLHGWWIPAQQPNAAVILYFHHNSVNIGANISQALQFHKLGYSVFLFDYRGFGRSQGMFPTESQVYEDAQFAWNYLTQERQIVPSQIVIYGHSVGGAIAIDLAARHPEAAALVVQSSFTSMRDMSKRFGFYWLLPVELLLKQRFESLEKMKSIELPVIIITGTEDIQIPVQMGERLYEAAAVKFKQLIIIQGGGHDNHLSKPYRQQVKQFLEKAMSIDRR